MKKHYLFLLNAKLIQTKRRLGLRKITLAVSVLSALVIITTISSFLFNYARSFDAIFSQANSRLANATQGLVNNIGMATAFTGRHAALGEIVPSRIVSVSSALQLNRLQSNSLRDWTPVASSEKGFDIRAAVFRSDGHSDNYLYISIATDVNKFARRRKAGTFWLTDSDYLVLKYSSQGKPPKYRLVAFEDKRDGQMSARAATYEANSALTPKISDASRLDGSVTGGAYDVYDGVWRIILRVAFSESPETIAAVAIGKGADIQSESFYTNFAGESPEEFAEALCDAILRGGPYSVPTDVEEATVFPDGGRSCTIPIAGAHDLAALDTDVSFEAYRMVHNALLSSYASIVSILHRVEQFAVPASELVSHTSLSVSGAQVGSITATRRRDSVLKDWQPFFIAHCLDFLINLFCLALLILVFYTWVLRRIDNLSQIVLKSLRARSTILSLTPHRSNDEIGILGQALRLWARRADMQTRRVSLRNIELSEKTKEIELRNKSLDTLASDLSRSSNELAARNRELEMLNGRLQRIAVQIRHDISGPLTILQRKYAEAPRAAQLYAGIKRTVDDILIEREIALETTHLNVCESLKNWLRNVQLEQNIPNIHVIYEDDCVMAYAEEDRLGVVLQHLLDNAIDFRDVDSKISITVEKLDPGAKITFQNMGPPIEEDDIERIFSYGISRRTRPTGANVGNGLHKARLYISGMGGTINARNSEDRRVEFHINLQ